MPGILGSYLSNSTGETWPLADQLVHCGLVNPDPSCESGLLQPDALNSNGTAIGTSVDLADGAPQLGGALSVTTETWFGVPATQHWYDITALNVEASGYAVVQPGDEAGLAACAMSHRCFIPVGVDWRLSAATNAQSVLSVVDRVLALTHSDRIDVLAHSQGGLIANALVHERASIGKIYRIVTLGTPYLGAPKLLSELLFAQPCQFPFSKAHGLVSGCLIDPPIVQRLIENFPGAAELAPSRAYLSASPVPPLQLTGTSAVTNDETYQYIADTLRAPPLNRDTSLIDAALRFHDQVDSWLPLDPTVGLLRMIGFDAGDAGGCSNAPTTDACVGTYDPRGTIVSPSANPDPNYVDSHLPPSAWGSGDGTVPLFSANLYDPASTFDDRGSGRNMYWCAVSHFGLAQSTPVWLKADSYLEGTVNFATDELGSTCPGGTIGSLATQSLIGAPSATQSGPPPEAVSATVCSLPATPATAITFVNTSTTDSLDIYWYDQQCHEELYASLPPQLRLDEGTFTGEVWHVRIHSTNALVASVSATSAPGLLALQ